MLHKIFRSFFSTIKTQFNVIVQILRTDNGTEFFNSILDNFLIDNDLIHQSSCVNSLQQNRISERKNYHLLEVALTLMFTSSVPKCF